MDSGQDRAGPAKQSHHFGQGVTDSSWGRGGYLGAKGSNFGIIPRIVYKPGYDLNHQDKISLIMEEFNDPIILKEFLKIYINVII